MSVGDRIRSARKKKGLTQKQLGELCKIAEPNIRKYESGRQNPKMQTLDKIAKALKIPLFDLMLEELEPLENTVNLLLKDKGKDLKWLAQKMDIPEDKLAGMISGDEYSSVNFVEKIYEALDYDVDMFIIESMRVRFTHQRQLIVQLLDSLGYEIRHAENLSNHESGGYDLEYEGKTYRIYDSELAELRSDLELYLDMQIKKIIKKKLPRKP